MEEHRPWGSYITYYKDKHMIMKRLLVKPGCRLSLQSHKERKEVWVVEYGTALVQVCDKEKLLNPGDTVEIKHGEKHRLSNPSETKSLSVAEIGWGNPREEDIVRYEDDFGRI